MDKKGEAKKVCRHCNGSGIGASNSSVVPPECPFCAGKGYIVNLTHDGLAMEVKHSDWCTWYMDKVCTCGELIIN